MEVFIEKDEININKYVQILHNYYFMTKENRHSMLGLKSMSELRKNLFI